ncbi:TIGR03086 family metal-binding protein [Streptomyces sp. NBC_01089]|uniref:TIGR03086 family metal-binding protein n=1 Tax=Streptomyces sp. NBC_01089 TaxID=2903747 RepID=UPI00386B464A|nr:TIGR03086 family metal-binding protein [Streptomyces sp. NBC_01089]
MDIETDTDATDTGAANTGAHRNQDGGLPDLEPPARHMAGLADAVGDGQLGDPTPCPDFAVRDLLAHVSGLTVAFCAAAKKEFGPHTDTAPGTVPNPELAADWRTALPRQLADLIAAWHSPGAWEGETRAGGFTLPAVVAGRIALNELVVHGWDLARATGQRYAPDPASLGVSYALLGQPDSPTRAPAFGPAVEVARDAPFVDRVIGLSGRSPDWKP